MTYLDLPFETHRPVQVRLNDGVWCDEYLELYREIEGAWSGFVRYSMEPGVGHLPRVVRSAADPRALIPIWTRGMAMSETNPSAVPAVAASGESALCYSTRSI